MVDWVACVWPLILMRSNCCASLPCTSRCEPHGFSHIPKFMCKKKKRRTENSSQVQSGWGVQNVDLHWGDRSRRPASLSGWRFNSLTGDGRTSGSNSLWVEKDNWRLALAVAIEARLGPVWGSLARASSSGGGDRGGACESAALLLLPTVVTRVLTTAAWAGLCGGGEGWKACIWPEPARHIWARVHVGIQTLTRRWTGEDCRAAAPTPRLRVRFSGLDAASRRAEPHVHWRAREFPRGIHSPSISVLCYARKRGRREVCQACVWKCNRLLIYEESECKRKKMQEGFCCREKKKKEQQVAIGGIFFFKYKELVSFDNIIQYDKNYNCFFTCKFKALNGFYEQTNKVNFFVQPVDSNVILRWI